MASGEEDMNYKLVDHTLTGEAAERQIVERVDAHKLPFRQLLEQLQTTIERFNNSSLIIHNFEVQSPTGSLIAMCDSGAPIGAISQKSFDRHFKSFPSLSINSLSRSFSGLGASINIKGRVALVPLKVGRRKEVKNVLVLITPSMRRRREN